MAGPCGVRPFHPQSLGANAEHANPSPNGSEGRRAVQGKARLILFLEEKSPMTNIVLSIALTLPWKKTSVYLAIDVVLQIVLTH